MTGAMQNPSRVRRGAFAVWLARGVAAAAAAYLIYLITMTIMQDRLVFPAAGVRSARLGPPPGVEQWWTGTDTDARVEAWFKPGRGRSAANPGPAVIYFHGNGDLIDYHWNALQHYRDAGISTLAVEFRGYGRSGGKPSIAGIVADGRAFREMLVQRPEVDPQQIIFHGLSLGGGLAIALSEDAPPAALIVEATFFSLDELIARFGLPPQLSRHRLDSGRIVAGLHVPLLVLHGRHDATIPVDHGRRLARAARHGQILELDCGHSDIQPPWPAVRQFLRESGLAVR
ncbi:Alpha/beta hydrolase family protein [Phycisphaerae bacterium RAS1]|nr:Alpha/beta hydrolase family protein [Phycisphaerae bacterium RAS1]